MIDEPSRNVFGQNFKTARVMAGISQRQLAKELEVSSSVLSAYEHGESLPSLEVILKAADILKVSLDILFERKNYLPLNSSVEEYRFQRAVELVRLAGAEVFELESGGYGIFKNRSVKKFTQGTGNLRKTAEERKAFICFESTSGFFDLIEFVENQTVQNGLPFSELLLDLATWWKNQGHLSYSSQNPKLS